MSVIKNFFIVLFLSIISCNPCDYKGSSKDTTKFKCNNEEIFIPEYSFIVENNELKEALEYSKQIWYTTSYSNNSDVVITVRFANEYEKNYLLMDAQGYSYIALNKNCEIIFGEILIDKNYRDDLNILMSHELGHVLGFDHSENNIMNPDLSCEYPSEFQLESLL